MNQFAFITLLIWPLVAVVLFAALPARRAAMATVMIGFLFLPMAGIGGLGGQVYDKSFAIAVGAAVGALMFDSGRVFSFRPSWLDIPMLVWCACPLLSSLSNGLGFHDGMVVAVYQVIRSGVPYLLGRVYFGDLPSIRELVIALCIGGLIYAPLCLFEAKMAPILHTVVYGAHQHQWSQAKRFGGWRPTVFLQHGLMVAMWMTGTTLAAAWLWASKSVRTVWGIPIGLAVCILVVTSILCRSVGPLMLLAIGAGVLALAHKDRGKWALVLLLLVPPAYEVTRITGVLSGQTMVEWTRSVFDDERAESLQFRQRNEDMVIARTWERPLLGWAGWGRAQAVDSEDGKAAILDGFWIIAFGYNGAVGLLSLTLAVTLPAWLFCLRVPQNRWLHPSVAPAAMLSLLCALSMIDNLANAMEIPLNIMAIGSLTGWCAAGLVARGASPRPVSGSPAIRTRVRRRQRQNAGAPVANAPAGPQSVVAQTGSVDAGR